MNLPERPFPSPLTIASRNYWRLSDLLRFEGNDGTADDIAPADDRMIPAPKVAARYDVTPMTLWRWRRRNAADNSGSEA